MAKTKQDYFMAGRADALAQNSRMNQPAAGWQFRAYNEGYDDALAELRAQNMTFERVKPAMAPQDDPAIAREREVLEGWALEDYMPQAAIEHCRVLRTQAGALDWRNPRCGRLIDKAHAIQAKYAARAARA